MGMRLVVGYGNTLRRDDGAALRVAELVAARGLPGVRVETAHELLPELAALVAQAERVVFVDAAVDAAGVAVRRVTPAAARGALTHTAGPGGILGLAATAYGAAHVEGWLVTVAAGDLGVGEGLSAETAALVEEAVEAVVGLVGGK